MKKSTKKLLLSTQAKNNKKFRVRTAGIKLDAFRLNPTLKYDHRDDMLPIGVAEDIEVLNDELYITPIFDESDPEALKIYNKWENGTLRMGSAGLNPLEWRNVDGELWLWESELIEASITPKGSNPESFAVALYDENKQLITLNADYLKTIHTTEMKLIELTGKELLVKLSLTETATADQFQAKLNELVLLSETQASAIVTLTAAKGKAEADKATAEADLLKLKNETAAAKLVQLHDTEVTVNRKVTEDAWKELEKLGYDSAKAVLDKMPANKTAEQLLSENANAAGELDDLVKLSWDELDKKDGALAKLKAGNMTVFKAKHKARFGVEYKEG